MEARNYAPNAQHNMILPADAQIVSGVSGNAVYLPAGCGTLEMSGTLDALGVSLWRTWDGVRETDSVRGIFSFKNFGSHFDNVSGKLSVTLPGGTAVQTDVEDDTELNHWVFNFIKNGKVSVYKNAVKVHEAQTAEGAVDLTDGFTLGGGKTHATFDEVYVHTELLKEEEIRGLYCLISSGMPNEQIQDIARSATAKYLGVTETVPDNRGVLIVKGEHLGTVYANTGDWVLMGKNEGGWKAGVCYRWSGLMWINLEPEYNYEAQYQSCLTHIFEIPELTKNMSHYGALFAKMLVTQKALIDNLVVKQLKIDADLLNDNNFEAYFDERRGLEITNEKKTILRVPPHGDSVFTGKVNVGAVQLLDSGVFIKDGEISIENNGWKGCLRPCADGVEFAIMGGDGGAMTKKQMHTVIRNGVLSLFVLGSISCENIYKNNSAGERWIAHAGGSFWHVRSMCYGNNMWVATDLGRIITSPDGITWTKRVTPFDKDLKYTEAGAFFSTAYGNGLWVAVGFKYYYRTKTDHGCVPAVMTSPDGITWTKRTVPTELRPGCAAYGNGLWVVICVNNRVITSPDGITWTETPFPQLGDIFSVAYGNGTWVVVGIDGYIATSHDGITWTKQTAPTGVHPTCVAYGNGLWVAPGVNSEIITSHDGITWTKQTVPFTTVDNFVAYGNNTWVIRSSGKNFITSHDGITWTPITIPSRQYVSCMAYGNNMWIAAELGTYSPEGEVYGAVFRSTDSTVTWTAQ